MARALVLILLLLMISMPTTCRAAAPATYDTGLAKVKLLIKAKDFAAAERRLKAMLRAYPDNPELMAMLARLLFWQHRHDASLAVYDRLLKRHPSGALTEERRKVRVAKELDAIDHELDKTVALQRLEELHESGAAPYESGYRLAALYLKTGSADKAIALADALAGKYPQDLGIKTVRISAYTKRARPEDLHLAQALLSEALLPAPGNGELLTLQASLYAKQAQYEQAVAWYDRALAANNDPAIAAERAKAALALDLGNCDALVEQGRTAEAEATLATLFKAGNGPGDAGERLASLHMRQGRYDKALPVLAALRKEQPDSISLEAAYQEAYILAAGVDQVRLRVDRELLLRPTDPDLLRFSGRLHLWDGDHTAAIKDFQQSLQLHAHEQTARELESAVLLQRLQGSHPLRLQLAASQPPELLRLQARYCFWKGRLDESLDLYLRLLAVRHWADDRKEMAQIEAAAESAEASIPPPANDQRIAAEARPNYLKITGEFTEYGKRLPNGRDFALELSRQLQTLTLVPSLANSTRFGKNDSQIGLGVHAPLVANVNGSLDFSVSPDAEFLPIWTAGAGITANIAPFEISAAYRHMAFRESAVDLLVPGVTHYVTGNLSLDGRLYLARSKGAFSVSIAPGIAYRLSRDWSTAYSVTAGRSAESIDTGGTGKVARFTAISQRAGCEYRYSPTISLGLDLSHTYRQRLYNTTGLSFYTRIRW